VRRFLLWVGDPGSGRVDGLNKIWEWVPSRRVRKWVKNRVGKCENAVNRRWCRKAWFGGFWWLDCPLATFREEGSRSSMLPLGAWPCTGRDVVVWV
jgi:hypothetical protein